MVLKSHLQNIKMILLLLVEGHLSGALDEAALEVCEAAGAQHVLRVFTKVSQSLGQPLRDVHAGQD